MILTIIALYSFRRALYAVGWATFGAMVGGGVMYWIGSISSSVSQYLDRIPLISESVITRGNTLLESQMYLGAFLGSFQGIPYKIFAGIIGAN